MNILTVFITVFLLFSTTFSHADTVTIRADEWYPINGVPGDPLPGYMIELAQIILAEHGHSVEYKVMPWERSLVKVREGKFDCVVGAYIDDAPDFVFPEQEWGRIESTFYVKQGSNWRYSGIDSLAGLKLGAIGGYAYSDELDAYIEDNKSSSVHLLKGNNALEQNIKKVNAGRIDVTIESHLVMEAKLKEMGMQGTIVPAGILGETNKMYIACSPAKPSSKVYAQYFSEGIENLRSSGALSTILNKYGLKDWK